MAVRHTSSPLSNPMLRSTHRGSQSQHHPYRVVSSWIDGGVMKVLLITAAVLVTAVPLVAHHGAATFDNEKELTLKRSETGRMRSNPHCYVKFDGKGDTRNIRKRHLHTQNGTTKRPAV